MTHTAKRRVSGTAGAMALLVLCASSAQADIKWKSQGQLGTENRVFFEDEGGGKRGNSTMVGRLTVDAKAKPFKMRLRTFVRHDVVDRQRSALFPEEAWLEWKKNPVRLRVGYQLLNWTATEAFHPADIINSRYFDGNVQNPEKLGEPMVALRVKFLSGNVEGYFMPFFINPILPSPQSRFRFAPEGISIDRTKVVTTRGGFTKRRRQLQWGVRLAQSIRSADVSLHAVQHVDRSLPLVFVTPQGAMRPPMTTLVYQAVTQFGGTYQQVFGPVIFKVEAAHRRYQAPDDGVFNLGQIPDRDHTLVAAGVEWGTGHDSGAESTFLVEGQNAFGLNRDLAGILLFQRDLLVGYRLDVGDEAGQTFLFSGIFDLEHAHQFFGNLEYGRRLGETWTTQLGVRLTSFPARDPAAPQGAEFLDRASYAYANLTRFF